MVLDKNGFLWIGTNEGLNVFDGYNVRTFVRAKNPAMASDIIDHLFCDSRNRVWMGTNHGATWLDENRNFNQATILDTLNLFACPTIFETKTNGTILFTSRGQFYYDSTASARYPAGKWKKLDWIPKAIEFNSFTDAQPFSDDQVIISSDKEVYILDYASKKVVFQKTFNRPMSACRTGPEEIAVGIQTGQVIYINIRTNQIVRSYQLTNELNGKTINTYLSEVRHASNGDLLVATDFAGLITIDLHGKIMRHTHDPMNGNSLSGNNTYRVFSGHNGEVIVGTYTSGVDIGNILNKPAGYTRIFKDAVGNIFDNYLTEIEEEGNGIFWIGAYDRLIRWDRKTNLSQFYNYYLESREGLRNLEIHALCLDQSGRVWVAPLANGIAILDKSTGKFKNVLRDTSLGRAVANPYVQTLTALSDGLIWVGTRGGVYIIDPTNQKIDNLSDQHLLDSLKGRRIMAIFEDRKKRIWFSALGEGVYCYDKQKQTLKRYTRKDGLASNVAYAITDDYMGNTYVATSLGLGIIDTKDSIESFTIDNGLRYERIEGLVEGRDGNIWIANNKCLLKYDPVRRRLECYEENAGLSIEGFRVASFLKAENGELLWGGQKGINFFFPEQLEITPTQIQLSITGMKVGDSIFRISRDREVSLAYANNDLTFYFTAIELNGSRDITYQYKLDGYDKEWHKGTDIREAHYSSVLPGKYSFLLKATHDQVNWLDSNNNLTVKIIPPIWMRWWFIAGIGVLLLLLIYRLLQNRNRKLKRHNEEREIEQAIYHFGASMYDQPNVETILWDVARNCISRLQFEDCVIYLVDEKQQALVQKAAYGPKNIVSNEIKEPLIIPIGKGITGSVAERAKPELIVDTSKDSRYIVDDVRRYSEICVPIISGGKVLGVIDCEHSKKHFFTQKHLSILTTIASLCANKIVRARAEEETKLAEKKLTDTNQKMAEAEMQALRAQMNPHFIFNCLNSINRYIVKSDQATASLYLTRFAKLIRLILDNSNSKNVILSNELEALRLYIEMEALRFDKKFSYDIVVDESVNAECLEVPPLIIQPYVENAIWHGLLHKENGGNLRIHVTMTGESMLQCTVQDDGIGREKARELKSKSAITRKSLGMKLTEGRISLLNRHAELNASIDIEDLWTVAGEPAGTKVILKIPI